MNLAEQARASVLVTEEATPAVAGVDSDSQLQKPDIEMPRVNILGVGVNVINMDDAVKLSERLIRSCRRGYVCVTDAHGVIEAQSDTAFRAILNNSYMTTPDGMPLVWAGKLQGQPAMDRVYGPDYLIEMCRISVERGYRHFFFGGKAGVADRLAAQLTRRFPGLEVVGTFTPPFRPLNQAEEKEIKVLIAEAKPDILWIGLGSPKQERFMAQYCNELDVTLMVGVGAAFDIHAGLIKEAPKWVKAAGLQWVHRLALEPRRLWRRYLVCVPMFLWKITLQLTGVRRFSHEG